MKFGEILSWRERPTTLADVMGSWTAYVLQMAADMRKYPSEVVGNFGYDDYIGALFARNHLHRAMSELSVTRLDVEWHFAQTADEYFRSFTRDDPGGAVIESEPLFAEHQRDESYWWLRRIPREGALGYEIARVARARAGLAY